MKKKEAWINIMIFPLVTVLLAGALFLHNRVVFANPDAAMYLYVKNARQGRLGYGFDDHYGNGISFADLEPGDIILGGYPGCAYGRFSHAGIYVGDGRVVEGYADLGVNTQPVEHYREYQEVCLLRVQAPAAVKARAVEYVQSQQGGLFYPVAFKNGQRFWNCTKIMWKAYMESGVDLSIREDFWVTPDEFYNSPWVSIIREQRV